MQIKVKNLSHIFAIKTPWEFQSLDDVSLEVQQGEYVGIIGQTGSGKTTFIEHLNALLKPTKGEVEWVYQDEIYNKKTKQKTKEMVTSVYTSKKRAKFKDAKRLRSRVGVVFQFAEYQLFKPTVEEDVIFGPMTYGVSKEEAIEKAKKYLELVGLPLSYLRSSPFDLSGGQKRKVALAGILAMEPDVLVVDEPTAGLDPTGVKDILDILTNLNNNGKTIINVTHDMDHVLARAKRVVVFKSGKIIRQGDPYAILNDIKFLEENALQPPQLLNFVNKLRAKGIDVPKVTSDQELINWLNEYREQKTKEVA